MTVTNNEKGVLEKFRTMEGFAEFLASLLDKEVK